VLYAGEKARESEMVEEEGIVNGKYRKEPNHGKGMSPVPPQRIRLSETRAILTRAKRAGRACSTCCMRISGSLEPLDLMRGSHGDSGSGQKESPLRTVFNCCPSSARAI